MKETYEYEFNFTTFENIKIPKNLLNDEWNEYIWYDRPVAYKSKNGHVLHYGYDLDDSEYWYLIHIKDKKLSDEYINKNLTYDELLSNDNVEVYGVTWGYDSMELKIVDKIDKTELGNKK